MNYFEYTSRNRSDYPQCGSPLVQDISKKNDFFLGHVDNTVSSV